jgi:hypothetical protein
MTFLVSACTDPITDITSPIYNLAKGYGNKEEQLQKLTLATFRTATAAALFFMIIPFNHIFGHHDNLSGSFAFASQFIVHPYAAALFNAFMSGGYPLVMKVTDIFASRQLIFTRNDLGGCVRAIGFCYIAQCLKVYLSHTPFVGQVSLVDQKYKLWATKFAHWYYK